MALLQLSEPGQTPDPHQRRIAIGIDLGTTHSLVASVRNGTPECLPDDAGRVLLPSVGRYLEDGRTQIGFDALAAQVGGIGIAPGANMSDSVACFEATHGTAPKYAGKDYVIPGSEILSAEMMLRHMGWTEAADLVIHALEKAILSKKVTYDFARLMDGATQVSCSGFGQVMIDQM